MALPALPFKIPEVQLPFDISVLMHPVVVHFVVAIPIVILLLEFINIFVKKRTIGVVSFFLLALVVVASAAAYLTGTIDGKEAYGLLNEAGQTELKSHKILGTYLMLTSFIVVLFKLLSSMIKRGMMKGLYLLVLIFFIFGILKQGKEGGELVYKYAANVQVTKISNDKIFDIKEEHTKLENKLNDTKKETTEVVEIKSHKLSENQTKIEIENIKEVTPIKAVTTKVEEVIPKITKPTEDKISNIRNDINSSTKIPSE